MLICGTEQVRKTRKQETCYVDGIVKSTRFQQKMAWRNLLESQQKRTLRNLRRILILFAPEISEPAGHRNSESFVRKLPECLTPLTDFASLAFSARTSSPCASIFLYSKSAVLSSAAAISAAESGQSPGLHSFSRSVAFLYCFCRTCGFWTASFVAST